MNYTDISTSCGEAEGAGRPLYFYKFYKQTDGETLGIVVGVIMYMYQVLALRTCSLFIREDFQTLSYLFRGLDV